MTGRIYATRQMIEDAIFAVPAVKDLILDELDPDRPGANWRRAQRALYRLMPSCVEDDEDDD